MTNQLLDKINYIAGQEPRSSTGSERKYSGRSKGCSKSIADQKLAEERKALYKTGTKQIKILMAVISMASRRSVFVDQLWRSGVSILQTLQRNARNYIVDTATAGLLTGNGVITLCHSMSQSHRRAQLLLVYCRSKRAECFLGRYWLLV